jgi:thiosulfate/3-mercaptopyruvate sulfurtransferase
MDSKASTEEVPVFVKAEDLHLYKCAKFIDVRDPNIYAEGHLKNAVNAYDFFTYLLPTSTKDDTDQMKKYFEKRFGELGITGKEHVIVYEQSMNNQYGASGRGFFILKYLKHPNVSALEGGIDALIQTEGGAQQITKELPTITACQYNGQDTDQTSYQMAGRDEVLQIVKNKRPNTHLLDVRDADEWNGLSSSPYGADFTPRKGRIPNSVWIEWYQFHELDNEKNVVKRKPTEQIQALMKEKHIQNNDEIIVYCFKGSRAAVVLMSLKQAGYNNVKNYFASWNEWSRDMQLPIDDQILNE